ncbi:MAG TPA: c-type cytochrome [Ignavibacteria bacterium]|jgi:hypothetical protein
MKKSSIFRLSIIIIFTASLITTISILSLKQVFSSSIIPGDDNKPAEEVYKNIQVLKGMPAGDLHMVMHFIRASLNVRCSFCHVHNEKDGTWTWESDSLEHKKTAREMITMVKNINTQFFEGVNSVTCFTCHRGGQRPAKTPVLPQFPPVVQKSEQPDNLPEASVVFDNYYKALGVTKPEDIKSKYSRGTSTLWDGKSFPIEIYQQAPDKFLSILTAPDGSKIYRGYDGNKGWTQNGNEINEVEGYDLEKLKQWADFYKDLDFKNRYTETKVLATDTVDGLTCYVVGGTINENKFDRLYFDISTGLLIRKTTSVKSILGSIPDRVEFGNYKATDGMKAPYSVRLSYLDPWAETIREFAEIKYNVSTDNINFSMPVK